MPYENIDPALIDAFRRGGPGARDELLEAVVPLILGWCARLGGPRVDAEDASHDVCIVLLTRIGSVREPERFPAWLFGVTRRVLAQHRRRAWIQRWVPGLALEPADPRADPGLDAEASETTRRVRLALEDLSAPHREVLVLFDLEERPESEVADLLDIPLGTARSRLRAARENFRKAARRHDVALPVVELARRGSR